MTTEVTSGREPAAGLVGTVTDEQLIAMLVDRARGDGLKLTGEGGLLQHLAKRVLESALDGEITDHVGYGKRDPAGRGSGNTRNGSRTKTGSPTSGRSKSAFDGMRRARSSRRSCGNGSGACRGWTTWSCRCRPRA